MTIDIARRIVLASRPVGEPSAENFRLEEYRIPLPGPGEVLLHTQWLSLDPYMRGRMSDEPSYMPPVEVNQPMEGGGVAKVIASNNPKYLAGDVVLGRLGWQTHVVSDGSSLRKLDPAVAPPSTALGVLGMPGLTAYIGVTEIGQPKPGETLVVAAASGAVGSMVGQLAKIRGARAVGIAGGEKKCRYVKDELGFDDCIDHRAPDFATRLAAACPKGIDVYFENVGGKVFEAVFPLLNFHARVPVCGVIAQYNATELPPGPNWVPKLMRGVLTKRLRVQGLLVGDHFSKPGEFYKEVAGWLREGKIKHREDIIEGLENAPRGLIGLLRGENFGKALVRVA